MQRESEKRLLANKLCLNGVPTYVTSLKAENPIASVHFIKGFKSSPSLYRELLIDLAENGINVTLVMLPDPKEAIDFIDDYHKIAKAVYIDGALDHLFGANIPKIAANHSMGGFLLSDLLMDKTNAEIFKDRYEHTIMAAPFYGTKYYRIFPLKFLSRIYSRAAGHIAVGTTWLERQFHQAADDEEYKEIKKLANHRQALYMDTPTKAFVLKLRKYGFPDIVKDIPMTFVSGNEDQVSYQKLIQEVANTSNSPCVELNGGHSLIRKTAEGRNLLISIILESIKNKKSPSNDDELSSIPYEPIAL